jgi:hypothetical protein
MALHQSIVEKMKGQNNNNIKIDSRDEKATKRQLEGFSNVNSEQVL